MTRLVRRVVTVLVIAAATAGASLWWLYEGDVRAVTHDVAALPGDTLP